MIELPDYRYHIASPLFAGIPHNTALVFGVLEGSTPGRVFVDECDTPSAALVTVEGAFSYLAGLPTPGAPASLVRLLFSDLLPGAAEKELVLFAFTNPWRSALYPLMQKHGAIRISRKTFSFNPERFASLAGWRKWIPAGMQLHPVDSALPGGLSELCASFDERSRRFGFVLQAGDEIASLCAAVSVGGGEAEIDVHTAETWRGRGLATLTACAFIEECLARGLRPAWSCWPYREASCGLARKLGFEDCPDAPAFYWAENMA